MPTDVETAPAAPWIEHGYATEDAVEFTFGKSTDELKGWQSFDTLRMLTTEAPKSVKFTLMQANVENLLLALGGGEIDDGGVYTPADASVIDIRALFISAVDGGDVWAFSSSRVMLSDAVTIPWKKSGEAQLPLTFSVQAATPAYKFVFPSDWGEGGSDIIATGAIEGTPGTFTPVGASPPADIGAMSSVSATPSAAWSGGSSVVLGDSSEAYWDGSSWSIGQAP